MTDDVQAGSLGLSVDEAKARYLLAPEECWLFFLRDDVAREPVQLIYLTESSADEAVNRFGPARVVHYRRADLPSEREQRLAEAVAAAIEWIPRDGDSVSGGYFDIMAKLRAALEQP